MKKIIYFSVKHPISVLMILISFLICGVISAEIIHIDYLPKMQDRFLLITAEYFGLPADQMKKLVTIQIEDSAASIKGIKNISSVTRDGLSLVQVELHWNIDIDLALTESRQIIDQCYEILPTGCSKPNVKIYNPYGKESIKIVIVPKDSNLEYGRYVSKNDFKPSFQRIEGVSNVLLSGGDTAEIHIIPDKTKIDSYGLYLSNISQIIKASNFEYPSGNVYDGNKKYVFKTDGLIKFVDDIGNIPIALDEDNFCKLSDIAKVKYDCKERESFFTYNGQECISLSIYKKSDASPIKVSKQVRNLINELNELHGDDFEFFIIQDLSEQLIESIKQLLLSLVVGVIITFIILLFCLRTIDISLIISSIMPFSILSSVFTLCICNRSINIISIVGIAIGLGMVIDSSIILIENSLKNLSTNKNISISQIVYKSTEEVYLSSVGSTITTIVVFIPFFFLSGITGKLFSDLSLAVISSIGFSCVLSITFVPAVLVLLFNKKKINDSEVVFIKKLETKYKNLLNIIFNHKKIIPIIVLSIILLAIFFLKLLPIEIMPKTYSPYISVELFFDVNCSYEYLEKNAYQINTSLKKDKNFIWYTIEGGIDDDSYEKFIKPDVRKECLTVTCKTYDVKKAFSFFKAMLAETDISYKIKTNKNLLEEIINTDSSLFIICGVTDTELKTNLVRYGVTDFYPDFIVSEYVFEPDRSVCARFNVSSSQIAQIGKEILDGTEAGYYYQKGKKIPIKVKYDRNIISNPNQLQDSLVRLTQNSIPISILGHFDYKKSEKIFYRYNRKDAKIAKVINSFTDKKNILNPNKENLTELINNSIYLLVVVVILIYCVMGAQFESFRIPLFMLISLPPAFAGAFMLLFFLGQTLNINSIIALVILFGTSVNNAIILYEAVKNTDISDENIKAKSIEKFRSILITSLTSICALIPFAIDPLHKNAQSSLSIAIIGGLMFSFVIVLTIVPVIFSVFLKKEKENC